MIRKSLAFAILLLLLSSLLSGASGEEEPVLATPTDLECLHEQAKTTIYFFDSPAYTSIDDETHLVSGPAVIRTECPDCGEVLSEETVSIAEEVRPHNIRRGECVLCGYRDRGTRAEEKPANSPDERVIIAAEDGTQDLCSVTLTGADLYQLELESVSYILVQGKTGETVIALDVTEVLRQAEEAGADLLIQLAEREDGSFFAGVFLVSDSGKLRPAGTGITLRFYRTSKSDVRIALAPAGADTLVEAESVWNEKGYWSVSYLEEGTYFLLQ